VYKCTCRAYSKYSIILKYKEFKKVFNCQSSYKNNEFMFVKSQKGSNIPFIILTLVFLGVKAKWFYVLLIKKADGIILHSS